MSFIASDMRPLVGKFWLIIIDVSYSNLIASKSEFYNGVLVKGSVFPGVLGVLH